MLLQSEYTVGFSCIEEDRFSHKVTTTVHHVLDMSGQLCFGFCVKCFGDCGLAVYADIVKVQFVVMLKLLKGLSAS